jgi:tetratricopeptide (TPR) repeat protein
MTAKAIALLILLIALASAVAAQHPPESGKTWALVIGVSKYQRLPGGQQLQFAERDAASVAEALEKRGVSNSNVKLLVGAEATTAAIKSAVGNWLAKSASESDTIIIFFSGHGFFEREFKASYLLGYDSDPKDAYGSALSINEIGQALARRVRSAHVLVIADALRRDFFDPDSNPVAAKSFQEALDQMTATRSGVSAILASGSGEFSREGQRWGGHGAFTKHLVDVLNEGIDRNSDGTITADELFDSISSRLAEDTSNKQHPWKSGSTMAQVTVARIERPVASTTVARAEPASKQTPELVKKASPEGTKQPEKSPSQKASLTKPAERQITAARGSDSTKAAPVSAEKSSNTGGLEAGVTNRAKTADSIARDAVANPKAEVALVKADASPKDTSSVSTRSEPIRTSTTQPVHPPKTEALSANAHPSPGGSARSEVSVANAPPAPKPAINLPSSVSISSDRAAVQPTSVLANVPSSRPEAAPSPLVLQLEVAIASNNLIEPKNNCAWDYYQRLASDPIAAPDIARLKPKLAQALAAQGRAIVVGDVRSDNISDRVDDFKRAGQLLARARLLAPEDSEVIAFEKLSAAEALISLQFFDEADRALAPLQSAKLASVENALGLVHQGRLDNFQAERAFKRAIELDSKWAAPHYNLALLYRSQQNQAALAELEAAAALDQTNVSIASGLAEEYFLRQQWKQAADMFRKAVALKPGDDNLHTKLGHALYSQGLQDEANREYQKARELRTKQ